MNDYELITSHAGFNQNSFTFENRLGQTPFMVAVTKPLANHQGGGGNTEVIKAVYYAMTRRSLGEERLMQSDNDGNNILHLICKEDYENTETTQNRDSVLSFLLSSKFSLISYKREFRQMVKQQNNDGFTPLQLFIKDVVIQDPSITIPEIEAKPVFRKLKKLVGDNSLEDELEEFYNRQPEDNQKRPQSRVEPLEIEEKEDQPLLKREAWNRRSNRGGKRKSRRRVSRRNRH
jgi:hypothetical protein